jgi:hypothetical protein
VLAPVAGEEPSIPIGIEWSGRPDLNRRPSRWQSSEAHIANQLRESRIALGA